MIGTFYIDFIRPLKEISMRAHPNGQSNREVSPSQKTIVRTTLVVTDVLNRNLEIYCAMNGMNKNDGVVKLITDQLAAQGFKPNQYPKQELNYI
jgi:hypothetical protein